MLLGSLYFYEFKENNTFLNNWVSLKKKRIRMEFSGDSVVRTPCFYCQGPGLNSWLGNWDPASCKAWPEKKNLSCHILTYKVSKFLISVSCLSREKWHWSWDIIKTESRGKIGKLQKKDSHEKPSWRKSSRTVSVIELCVVSSFLYCGIFPGIWAFNLDKESTDL